MFWRDSRWSGTRDAKRVGGMQPVTRTISRLAAAAVGLALFLSAAPSYAQDVTDSSGGRDFCADRPGKGTPACTLEPGRFQAEVGFVDYSHFQQGGVEDTGYDYGSLTLRLGLTDSMEGQILWTPYSVAREKVGGVTFEDTGSGDIGFSLRQAFTPADTTGISVAVQAIVTAPTGSNGISADVWEGAILMPIDIPLSDDWAMELTPEVDIVGDSLGGGHHAAWAGSIGVTRQVSEVELGAELWASRDDDPAGGTTQASFDLTAAWMPGGLHDVQFDVGVNFGLNSDTPDVEIGAGIAKRF